MGGRITRRQWLTGAGATAGAAALASATIFADEPGKEPVPSRPVDRVVRTTCSPNCTGSCGQLAFVRDGRVVKIQQAADYPDPVYSPRGCMKGLSFHLHIHGPERLTKPLIRSGARGSGEFREASWEEALDHVAAELKRIGETYGYETIHVFGQVPGSGYVHKGANYRACAVLGMSHGTSFDYNGDLPMAMPITFGVQNAEHEAKDWANARFLLVVGANPLETRIPDVHFLFDAVANGARLVVVDPVFSSTAAKADRWVRLRPGTDAAFALGLAHVIWRERLHDEGFLRAYTDAPLLVDERTGRRVRESDLRVGGSAERFVVWDERSGGPMVVGTDRLGMPDGVEPALTGSYEVRLADGGRAQVRPGFDHVRVEIESWRPERAAEVCGTSAEVIESLGRAYAAAKPAAILMGGGANHWYHGDLIGRAYALLAVLTGNIGRSGGGFSVYVGQYKVRLPTQSWWYPDKRKPPIVSTIYWIEGRTETMHPAVPYPERGFKALFLTFSNFLLQSPNLNKVFQRLREMELVVAVDPQRTETTQWADVVLPATTWYEKTDLTATPLHPFLQLQQPAIEPEGEARSELEIWSELVRRIDPEQWRRYFQGEDEESAIRTMLAAGDYPGGPTEGITLEQLRQGPVRLRVPDPDIPFLEQIEARRPFPPASLPAPIEATQVFLPTRRIELYKEERRFLELGEQVVTHKDPHDDGVHDPVRYPLRLLSPHSKWRIHSTYSNNPWLEEIHGGRPRVLLHPADAQARGIREGDEIEVFNERGSLTAWAHVSEAAAIGTATLPEGWWSRYFLAGRGVNELTSSSINPIHEIWYVPNIWAPSTGWKDCRCEVRGHGSPGRDRPAAGPAGHAMSSRGRSPRSSRIPRSSARADHAATGHRHPDLARTRANGGGAS
ncbi:MAG: molybdopterin-dependent oxidoreductase [Myxococcales bacterium]|nr:molybdopterin-dependent oxidoreductase [Myxococcales bacterium]